MKDDILTGYKLGADDYITKPFDSEVLLHKIKAILKRNEELQEKQHSQVEFNIGGYHFNSKLYIVSIVKNQYNCVILSCNHFE